jgi:hypothetical protein
MCRKVSFLILVSICIGFCLWFGVGKTSGTGEKVANVIRGDANGDGEINGGDVVYLIVYFYKNGPPPPTLIHGDANGDGEIDIADIVYLLNYLFLGGPPPPPEE